MGAADAGRVVQAGVLVAAFLQVLDALGGVDLHVLLGAEHDGAGRAGLDAGRFLADGRYELKVPYSVSRELLMDVLHYGSDAEIIEPTVLREQAKALLMMALSNYE